MQRNRIQLSMKLLPNCHCERSEAIPLLKAEQVARLLRRGVYPAIGGAPANDRARVTLSAVPTAVQVGTESKGAVSSLRLRSHKTLTALRLTMLFVIFQNAALRHPEKRDIHALCWRGLGTRKDFFRVFGSTLIICVILFICLANTAHAQIAIAVNKDNPVDDISMSELKQIYTGKKTTFPDGKNIVLAEYADLKETFYDILLDWSVIKMRKHWMGLIFSGTSSAAPKEFKRSGELRDFISQNEGAIAFMDPAEVDKKVKLLTINGKKPGSKDYPLQ